MAEIIGYVSKRGPTRLQHKEDQEIKINIPLQVADDQRREVTSVQPEEVSNELELEHSADPMKMKITEAHNAGVQPCETSSTSPPKEKAEAVVERDQPRLKESESAMLVDTSIKEKPLSDAAQRIRDRLAKGKTVQITTKSSHNKVLEIKKSLGRSKKHKVRKEDIIRRMTMPTFVTAKASAGLTPEQIQKSRMQHKRKLLGTQAAATNKRAIRDRARMKR